jgi:hypothetical protein
LKRLGVTETQIQAGPDITSLLKQGRGGLKAAMEAMRFSTDESVLEFVARHDAIPARDRISAPWEAIALAANVDVTHLLGAAILAIQAHSASAVKIIALSNHPLMMRKRLQFGAMIGGRHDRDAVDTGLGFLPQAKGSTFIINPGVRPKDEDEDEPEDDAREGDLDHLFPSVAKIQNKLMPMRARMIEAETR